MSAAFDNALKLKHYGMVPGLVLGSDAAKTGNATKIQAAIDALSSAGVNGQIQLPPGVVYSGKVQRRGSVGISGSGEQATTLILGASVNDNLLVDERWENNTLFSQPPCLIENLTLDGNKANNSSGSCYVGQTYWSTYRAVTFQNAAERGAIMSTTTKSGANIGNGVADNEWQNVRFANNGLSGWYGRDVNNLLADQRFSACDFDSNGSATVAQFLSDRFAGFVVGGNSRFYNGFAGGDMDVYKFGISQIVDCHFELTAKNSPNTAVIVPNVRVRSWGGVGTRFSVIANNLFWMQAANKTATDIYCAIYFDLASEALALTGNVFQAAASIATKRAVHGATSMVGTCFPNTFLGYTSGTEYGTAWNSWTRTAAGAAATDAATTQTLANNLRTALINAGVVNA